MLALNSGEIPVCLTYLRITLSLPCLLCAQTSSLVVSCFFMASLQYRICLSWPSLHYYFETHLSKIDLRQTKSSSSSSSRGSAAQCSSAAGRQASARLWARNTQTHTHTRRVLTLIHSHGITEIRETKWEKQLYLFSADPATARGGLLTSQWACQGARLFVASWWWFCFVYLFTSPIKDAKKKNKWMCGDDRQLARVMGDTDRCDVHIG